MTKAQIIEGIARTELVQKCIRKVVPYWRPEYDDLVQDILLDLYNKREDIIVGLWDRHQIEYYITRIVKNNLRSVTSRFYYGYRKFSLLSSELNEQIEAPEGGEW